MKLRLPSREEALPGRAEPLPVAPRHYVNGAAMLPPFPPAMIEAGGDYEIEYVSPAMRMNRNQELVAMQRTAAAALPFIELDPKKVEIFDFDAFVRAHMEILGGPSKTLRTKEEFQEILAQMAEQEQKAQLAAAMEQMAKTAKDGAGALSMIQGGAQVSAA